MHKIIELAIFPTAKRKYAWYIYIQVHLNKLECRGKVNFSNSTQIVKLVY